MRRESYYSGKCSKHGGWNSDYIDECPKCAEDDYLRSEDDYWSSFGMCLQCHWCSPDDSPKICQHPKRKHYPTKPRKRKCKYFKHPEPPKWEDLGYY